MTIAAADSFAINTNIANSEHKDSYRIQRDSRVTMNSISCRAMRTQVPVSTTRPVYFVGLPPCRHIDSPAIK